MKDWHVLVTTPPGEEWDPSPAFRRLGEFIRSECAGIFLGRVEDTPQFLPAVRLASKAAAAWRSHLLCVLSMERIFSFTPRTLEEHLREAVTPFVQHVTKRVRTYESCPSRRRPVLRGGEYAPAGLLFRVSVSFSGTKPARHAERKEDLSLRYPWLLRLHLVTV